VWLTILVCLRSLPLNGISSRVHRGSNTQKCNRVTLTYVYDRPWFRVDIRTRLPTVVTSRTHSGRARPRSEVRGSCGKGCASSAGCCGVGAGVIALGAYGFVATFQPDPNFGRILAAYGGIFLAGSLAWGVVVDCFRPDRWDIAGAAVCILGVALIMNAPRG
jgi:small multidrug resistance family-3 protein